jgi:predicted Zn-dependent protease
MNREVARQFLSSLLMEFAKRIIQIMHRQYINNQPFSDSELKGWVDEYAEKILSNSRTD